MDSSFARLQIFLYGTNFSHGLRRGVGVFMAIALWFGLSNNHDHGFAFCGAVLSLSFCESHNSYYRASINELGICALMISVASAITFYIAPYPSISWVVLGAMIFSLSMLSVYGSMGILISFCTQFSALVALTASTQGNIDPLSGSILAPLGCLFYFVYSISLGFFLRHQQDRQIVANAVYLTAQHVYLRSRLYDVNVDMQQAYNDLLKNSTKMIAAHRSARELVLRYLPDPKQKHYQTRLRLWNIYTYLNSIQDTLVATQPDYEFLRNSLGNHDALLFMRDTMVKLSKTLMQASLDILKQKPLTYKNSVKAELRALEFEIETFKSEGLNKSNPDLYLLLVQLQRRLRNTNFFVSAIGDNLKKDEVTETNRIFKHTESLHNLRTSTGFSLRKLRDNFTLKSGAFRYSVRLTCAFMVVLLSESAIAYIPMSDEACEIISEHFNWLMITVLLVMRPGFATTFKRSNLRIAGTVMGCAVTLVILTLVHNNYAQLAIMLVMMVCAHTFTPLNLKVGSVFTTTYILMGFHMLTPGSYWVVGERFADTLIACIISFGFSFMLPRWEKEGLPNLAINLTDSLRNYLYHAVEYLRSPELQNNKDNDNKDDPEFVEMQIARKNTQNSYTSLYDSFNNMVQEPKKKRLDTGSINIILRQTEHLASHISAVRDVALDRGLSPAAEQSLRHVIKTLDLHQELTDPVPPIDSTEEYLDLRYPIKQMNYAAQQIREAAIKLHFEDFKKKAHD